MKGNMIQPEIVANLVEALIANIKELKLDESNSSFWDMVSNNPAYFIYEVKGRSPLAIAQGIRDQAKDQKLDKFSQPAQAQLDRIYQLAIDFYLNTLEYFNPAKHIDAQIKEILEVQMDQLMTPNKKSQTPALVKWSPLHWAMACRQQETTITALCKQSPSEIDFYDLLKVAVETQYASYLQELLRQPGNESDKLNIFKYAITKGNEKICDLILTIAANDNNCAQYLVAAKQHFYARGANFIMETFNITPVNPPQLGFENFLLSDAHLDFLTSLLLQNQDSLAKKVNLPYENINVLGDGDCGYSSMFTTRQDALIRITHALENDDPKSLQVISFLEPAIRDQIVNEKFINYLLDNAYITEDSEIYSTYLAYLSLSGEDQTTASNKLLEFVTDINIVRAYVQYDVKDKMVDLGWAHPCTLLVLAYLQNIYLCLWEKDKNDDLIPHHLFPGYEPKDKTDSTSVIDIVFSKGGYEATSANHFSSILFKDPVFKEKLRAQGGMTTTSTTASIQSNYDSPVPLFNSQHNATGVNFATDNNNNNNNNNSGSNNSL